MLARLPRPAAVILALFLAAMCAWCLTTKPPPIKTAAKGGYTDTRLYHDITKAVVGGKSYYQAAAELQRQHHYPLKPFVTMRLPTEIWGAATFGWAGMQKIAFALVLIAVFAWVIAFEGQLHWTERVLVAVAIGTGGSMVADQGLMALHEYWTGMLLTLGLAGVVGWPRKWWWVMLPIAIGLTMRELVLPFALLALVFAMVEKRKAEATAWGALILGFVAMMLVHQHFEVLQVRPTDLASPGWSAMQGYSAFLKAVIFTSVLQQLPLPLALLAAMLPSVGWLALTGRSGLFSILLVAGYTAMIALFSRADTFYWGAIMLAWYFVGYALLPRALWQLYGAIRHPASHAGAPITA